MYSQCLYIERCNANWFIIKDNQYFLSFRKSTHLYTISFQSTKADKIELTKLLGLKADKTALELFITDDYFNRHVSGLDQDLKDCINTMGEKVSASVLVREGLFFLQKHLFLIEFEKPLEYFSDLLSLIEGLSHAKSWS